MKLLEILDTIKTVTDGHPNIKESTICTMEDLITDVSEKKNKYVGAFIVYDINNVPIGEYSVTVPISIIFADKLRTNDGNKAFIHSNTLSISIDIVSLLRIKIKQIGADGLNDCVADIWTEQFADSLLAGTKLDFTIQTDLGGFCDILNF